MHIASKGYELNTLNGTIKSLAFDARDTAKHGGAASGFLSLETHLLYPRNIL